MAIYRSATPRSAKRAAVERALLGAVEELLAEGASFAELGIERIASRAGISRTAFYFYFADKRELLLRLTEDTVQLLYEEATGWWSADGDGREELPIALGRILDLYFEHGLVLRAVVEAASNNEAIATFWRALAGRFIQASQERIEAEQLVGRALPGPAQAMAFALVWGVERACYQQVVQGRPIAQQALRRALIAMWQRAVYGGAEHDPAS